MPLCREFKEAGLTALFGCGFAPGWTNVLARRLANRLDRVDSIKMRIGKATHLPGEHEYDWVLRPWNPGWSPKQAKEKDIVTGIVQRYTDICAGGWKIRAVSSVRRTGDVGFP